jgi:4-diphosphocytidyl-2-C-methyl-D-erythritol kinase
MRSLVVTAPAKINLLLRILGKRRDGYHEIFTLFQRIGLADRLFLKKRKSGFRLFTDQPSLAVDQSNLVFKAHRLLDKECGLRGGVEIFLKKNIPLAAGLGGGSSDAAAALTGLNRLFRLGLTQEALIYLGRKLGADVPFFLLETSQAVGVGRGDWVRAFPKPASYSIFLLFFPQGLFTREVYRRWHKTGKLPGLTGVSCDATMASKFLAGGDLESASRYLGNDLLEPACRIKPAIRQVLSFLKAYSPASQMTGSGPTLFGLASSAREARALAAKASAKFGLAKWVGKIG